MTVQTVLDAETFLNERTQPGSMFEPAYSKEDSNFCASSRTEEWLTLEP